MPPRYAYWTIILDGTPTSFRTKERDEILPLFNQLRAKNPGAELKWFSGGKIWESPDQAREARAVEKVRAFREQRSQQVKAEREGGEDPLAEFRKQHGRPADGSDDPSIRSGSERPPGAGPSFRQNDDARPHVKQPWSPGSFPRPGSGQADPGAPNAPRREGRGAGAPDRRNKDWRPGGEHKDPRDKYKLPPGEARKRWKDRNLGPRGPKPFGPKPFGPEAGGSDRTRDGRPGGDRPWGDKPRGPKPFGQKPGGPRRFDERPEGERPFRPKPFGSKPFSPKPRSDRPWGDKPRGPKPFGAKPAGPGGPRKFGGPSTRKGGDRSLRPGKPFGSNPSGDRPWGDRPRGPKPFGSKPGGPRKFGGPPKGPSGPRPFRGKPGKPGGPRGKR